MTETIAHDCLQSRHVLEAILECTSALHIGTGKSDEARSIADMPIARNGAGQPYIPGSSFRGSYRSGLEALLRGLGRKVCNPLAKDLGQVGTSCSARIAERRRSMTNLTEDRAFELAEDVSCDICRLFGNSFLASRVWIPDLILRGKTRSYTRDGVGIDRDLRTAAKGILYNFEALPAGTTFRLRLDVDNGSDHELGLILTGLDLFKDGLIGLGGKRARGLGQVRFSSVQLRRWKAADFFEADAQGAVLEEKDLRACKALARTRYLREEG